MSYRVTISGKNYELPARTLAVDDLIEGIVQADKAYQNGEITRREAVAQLHQFVETLSPGALPAVDEVDTNELMKACEDIILAYEAPARKARLEARLSEARDVVNRPEVQKLLTLVQAKK